MPPVFGPSSPSRRRLWSRAAGRATTSRPSVIAMTLASRPTSRSSIRTTRSGPARKSRSRYGPTARGVAGIVDADALAGGEPVLLDDEAATGRRRTTAPPPSPRPPTGRRWPRPSGHRRPGCDLVAERLGRLDPGGRGGGPERHDAGRPQRVGQAVGQRLLRADDRELDRVRAGDVHDRGVVGGRAPSTQRTRGSSPIASLPGATTTRLTPGSPDSFQASACSRPPPPTTRIRVGITAGLIPAPRSRGRPR